MRTKEIFPRVGGAINRAVEANRKGPTTRKERRIAVASGLIAGAVATSICTVAANEPSIAEIFSTAVGSLGFCLIEGGLFSDIVKNRLRGFGLKSQQK